jgi:hypothetical protein
MLWLVRVAGPGQHGASVPLARNIVLGGPGADLVLVSDDPRLGARHARIVVEGNDVSIVPLDGVVELDGQPLRAQAPIHDGHTLGLGQGLYVVRIVRRWVA